jgi:hypothetical protein
MSRNRVIITLLAIFLIAGMVSLAAAADDKEKAPIKTFKPTDPMTGPAGGVAKQGANQEANSGVSTYTSWSGYAKIGGGYSYVYSTTGYQYLYVSGVYGTSDTGYNGYYRVYPSTYISASNAAQTMYETGLQSNFFSHWVYIAINSNGYVYEVDFTPYTYGTL